MPYQLTFAKLHEYDAGKSGISIEVILQAGLQNQRLTAKLDSGSSFCIFQQEYGEALGLDIESGQPQWIGSPMGEFLTYGHGVTLSALGFDFDIVAYFTAAPNFTRNVLGRHGWLQKVRMGVVDYDGKLYVSDYNDPL